MSRTAFVYLLQVLTLTDHHAAITSYPQKMDEEEIQKPHISADLSVRETTSVDGLLRNTVFMNFINKCEMNSGAMYNTGCILTVIFLHFDISECVFSLRNFCLQYTFKDEIMKKLCKELKKLKYHETFDNSSRCADTVSQFHHFLVTSSSMTFMGRKLLSKGDRKRNKRQVNDLPVASLDKIRKLGKGEPVDRDKRLIKQGQFRSRKQEWHRQKSEQSTSREITGDTAVPKPEKSPSQKYAKLHSKVHHVGNLSNATLDRLAEEEYREFVRSMEQIFSKDPLRALFSVSFLMMVLMVAIKLCGMKPIRRKHEILDYRDDDHHVSIYEILKMKRPFLPKKLFRWERRLRRKLRRKHKMKKQVDLEEQIVSDNSEEESLIYSQAVDF